VGWRRRACTWVLADAAARRVAVAALHCIALHWRQWDGNAGARPRALIPPLAAPCCTPQAAGAVTGAAAAGAGLAAGGAALAKGVLVDRPLGAVQRAAAHDVYIRPRHELGEPGLLGQVGRCCRCRRCRCCCLGVHACTRSVPGSCSNLPGWLRCERSRVPPRLAHMTPAHLPIHLDPRRPRRRWWTGRWGRCSAPRVGAAAAGAARLLLLP
jgi:hypothetical protein